MRDVFSKNASCIELYYMGSVVDVVCLFCVECSNGCLTSLVWEHRLRNKTNIKKVNTFYFPYFSSLLLTFNTNGGE